jgi:hypothetical protein
MRNNHRFANNRCQLCGCTRERKGYKILMATVNHPPWNVYKYYYKFAYSGGPGGTTFARPACWQIQKQNQKNINA